MWWGGVGGGGEERQRRFVLDSFKRKKNILEKYFSLCLTVNAACDMHCEFKTKKSSLRMGIKGKNCQRNVYKRFTLFKWSNWLYSQTHESIFFKEAKV